MTLPPQRGLSQRAHWAGGDKLISRLMAEALARPDIVSLAAGFVDQSTLPVEAVREALDAVCSDPALARAALQYGTTIGHVPLREAILARWAKAEEAAAGEGGVEGDSPVFAWAKTGTVPGAKTGTVPGAKTGTVPSAKTGRVTKPTLDRVVITAGSNQLLHLVADTLLDPGDIVLTAAPSYFVFLATLANVGARTIGVATDDEGIVPEALEDELVRRAAAGELARVKAIYVVSYYDNPTGVTMPLARRRQLLQIARRWSQEGTIYVIEDAAYRELRYYGAETPSLLALDEHESVIHAGTFSKPYSPGIRVGWGILPRQLVEPVLAQKGNVDFGSPHFSQVLMAAAMERGLFDRHVAGVRASYRRKLDATLAAAEEELAPLGVKWVAPQGGLYVWLQMPAPLDTGIDGPLFSRAVGEGMLYVPGECCYPLEGCPRPRNMLRLSFGVPSIEEIRRGVKAIGKAIGSLKP